jgi:protein ImuB
MVVCVYLPRFELVIAAGGPEALAGRALAIAPLPGAEARVGEASGAAEAFGVQAGMALGEALARCPELGLVAGDPLGVVRAWDAVARALEGIGAALELDRPGLAYFEADGLRGLHGDYEGVIAAARRAIRTAGRASIGVGRSARVGAGPTRFCALAAALEARTRRAVVVDGKRIRGYLSCQPVELLRFRAETAALVEPLRRLGVRTLGELRELAPASRDASVPRDASAPCDASVPRDASPPCDASVPRDASASRGALADRFGKAGVLAHRLACGEDTPLRTRRIEDRLEESLELGEPGSGPALERVLGVLVDRLLARPERRGRTFRAALLSARLVEGGTWHERVVFRQALSDARRMRLALSLRMVLLPAPAEALRLAVERFGPPDGEQGTLLESASTVRLACLREAVKQVRTVAGPEAALRALCVDPDSRVPERRVVFTPFPG